MFDQQQPLPSDYGSPGSDPPSLSPLAGAEGVLPNAYGAAKTSGSAPENKEQKAEQRAQDISDFTRGLLTTVEESDLTRTFQSSGKASSPADDSKAPSDASKQWKAVAGVTLAVAVLGGTLWYGSKQGWFTSKEAS